MTFGFSISFSDLYSRAGLVRLDGLFFAFLEAENKGIAEHLLKARKDPHALAAKDESELLVEVGKYLESFISKLFKVEKEYNSLRKTHDDLLPLYSCKRLFVQRQAVKKGADASDQMPAEEKKLLEQSFGEAFSEIAFARNVNCWLETPEKFEKEIEAALKYAAWATLTDEGHKAHGNGILFKTPRKLDYANLVHTPTPRVRDGFKLTDTGCGLSYALDQANYCIYCHNQGKDSCSKGSKEKDGSFKKNPLGITLAGCPLEEKISEMNLLKFDGYGLAALAVACVDNPMLAATGHRICNDCMKACIYQKQEPVNIPEIETRTLKDVLELPYGFEIYSLLTRWNPLNIRRWMPRMETGKKVLVAGMGPAGFTLSHHLLNDGHTVVGIDGLKIEPLNLPFEPIKDVKTLYESLDDRVMAGFGGVAEYGITVRWDKNFLKLIRILLERRENFMLAGGTRLGSNITVDSAFELGFDHIALCMGAGKPTVLDIPNALCRGVRAASDFLMALQLTGAAKESSIANLQILLPVVVIGGGLTAVDTATESLAYYPLQVEKFLKRVEILGREKVFASYNEEEKIIAEEFITHAKAIREEKKKSNPDVVGLIKSWGGVKLAYRKSLQDSPAYRLNHEEVEKALEEGIEFLPNLTPKEFITDEYGHVQDILFEDGTKLPARSVLVAAGTSPNTVLAREDKSISVDKKFFQALNANNEKIEPEKVAKPSEVAVITSFRADGKSISFFGDLHPSFAGNVVKAMASAKQGYPLVTAALQKVTGDKLQVASEFLTHIKSVLQATVHSVEVLAPGIVEVVIHSPLAAKQFKPGQFFRLQNFETLAPHNDKLSTTLAMEGLALTGAWVDVEKGLVSTIVLEMGGSSNLCRHLKKGEPVVLMGPTGEPTEIPENKTIMLVGGGLGNAVLFSIGKAALEKGCKVLYFAGYRRNQDRFKIDDIEKASSVVVWCTDEKPEFTTPRPQDRIFHGNIVEAIKAYGEGKLGDPEIKLSQAERIIAIGSDGMMAAIKEARKQKLANLLNPNHVAIGSINSPMQCMMKEICAQCLQKHNVNGAETYVYSCFNQDQCLDEVDFPHLKSRLMQNTVQEKITTHWIKENLNQI